MAKRLHRLTVTTALALAVLLSAGCPNESGETDGQAKPVLRLATTTSTVGSGLLAELLPLFEGTHGFRTEVTGCGTGAALQLARQGQADVVLVHARSAEDKFILEGYGINRRDVMANDFVILGPPDDPASLAGIRDVLVALKQISVRQASFLSRGDDSGTHMREMSLWQLAEIAPSGQWYIRSGKGMLDTLAAASAQKAYVLSDRSTYLFNREELKMAVLVEGDRRLLNVYGVIATNPNKVSGVNFTAAMAFVDFITSAPGQKLIAKYGRDTFGRALFTPLVVD